MSTSQRVKITFDEFEMDWLNAKAKEYGCTIPKLIRDILAIRRGEDEAADRIKYPKTARAAVKRFRAEP